MEKDENFRKKKRFFFILMLVNRRYIHTIQIQGYNCNELEETKKKNEILMAIATEFS